MSGDPSSLSPLSPASSTTPPPGGPGNPGTPRPPLRPALRPAPVPLWSGSDDKWSMSSQVFALVVLLLLVVVVPVWAISLRSVDENARNEAIERARSTSEALAESPWVIEAVTSPDPTAVLSDAVGRIEEDNRLAFIVVMATDGHRWTHPDETQIGGVYLGTIDEAVAGGIVVEEYVGTLGRSVRVVTPVFSDGKVIALVAAGVLMDSVDRVSRERSLQFLVIIGGSLAVGTFGTWLIARRLHKQTRSLGPRGLSRLFSYHEALLHSVRAGLVLVGRDGTVVLCNDFARELINTPSVEPGQRVTELWLDPELAELMSSGRVCDGETIVEDGRALVVTQVRAVIDGEDLGWVTTLQDRTDVVRLTGELDSARAFGEMLRSRAHEADNRLHTVVMLVEMGRTDEAVRLATATIEQSQALVDAVTGAVRDAPLAALLLGKAAQAEERGVSLRLARDLDVPEIGDLQGDVLVILGNLIDNAIDAAAAADEPRWVEVGGRGEPADAVRTDGRPDGRTDDRPAQSLEDRPVQSLEDRPVQSLEDRPVQSLEDRPAQSLEDRPAQPLDDRPVQPPDCPAQPPDHQTPTAFVRFEVVDSGPGIPEALVSSAFQRGWTTKTSDESGRPQGRGLGLSLVAGTVRRLGGTLEVSQSPSRFTIRLPLPNTTDEEGTQ